MFKGDTMKGLDLRKTKAQTVVADTVDPGELEFDEVGKPWVDKLGLDLTAAQWVRLGVRAVLITCGVIGLKIYEKHNLKTLNKQQTTAEGILANLKTQKQALEKDIKGFKSSSEQSDQLGGRMDIIERIVTDRSLAIKGLDQIQNAIPEKVWLNRIQYDNKKFKIEGTSVSAKEIEIFVEQMEKRQIFSTVTLNEVKEQQASAKNTFKKKTFSVETTFSVKDKKGAIN